MLFSKFIELWAPSGNLNTCTYPHRIVFPVGVYCNVYLLRLACLWNNELIVLKPPAVCRIICQIAFSKYGYWKEHCQYIKNVYTSAYENTFRIIASTSSLAAKCKILSNQHLMCDDCLPGLIVGCAPSIQLLITSHSSWPVVVCFLILMCWEY